MEHTSGVDAIECKNLSRPEDGFSFNGKLISQRTLAAKNGYRIVKETLTNIDPLVHYYLDELPIHLFKLSLGSCFVTNAFRNKNNVNPAITITFLL